MGIFRNIVSNASEGEHPLHMKAASIYASITLNNTNTNLIAKRILEVKKIYKHDMHAHNYRTFGSPHGYRNMVLPAITCE